MNDLHTLRDAFAELERRADAVTTAMPTDSSALTSRPRTPVRRAWPASRVLPVAAAAAAVVGLAVGVTLLAPRGIPASQTVVAPGSQPTSEQAVSAAQSRSPVTDSPTELAQRFRVVLGDTATFTVVDTGHAVVITVPPAPPSAPRSAPSHSAGPGGTLVSADPGTRVGAAIVGTLTASGHTGGFDLQIFPGTPGQPVQCADSDPARCTVRQLPDGSSLATAQVPLQGAPGSVTYEVTLVHPDGTTFLMHVSNQRSPKGASELLTAQPPLTIDQMIAIATSDRW